MKISRNDNKERENYERYYNLWKKFKISYFLNLYDVQNVANKKKI